MKSCFLFGHSDCPQDMLSKIATAIEDLYMNYGIRQFDVGNRGTFDRLTATALRQCKLQHPEIELYLLVAYHPARCCASLKMKNPCSIEGWNKDWGGVGYVPLFQF